MQTKEEINKSRRDHYHRNRERLLKQKREWKLKNRERDLKNKREWYVKNRLKVNAYFRESLKKLRKECLGKLGEKCVICGEDNERYLHLDRIKGGAHSRQQYWIKNHLDEFQLLCANHHNEKTVYKEILWNKKSIKF